MKIDRMIGILSILLQEEKTTAPKLAERFEVSKRTINRDIEALCKAGVPIRTSQGAGGGISIMEGYRAGFHSDRFVIMVSGFAGAEDRNDTGCDRGQALDQLSILFSVRGRQSYC